MAHNVALPKHRYVWVDDSFVLKEPKGELIPAVWFGISSHPGRAFGCHILLECGATIIDLPLHCLRWKPDAPLVESKYEIRASVYWDSFGWDVEVFEPPYLTDLSINLVHGVEDILEDYGTAWFALDWKDNGWSDYPEQHKWMWVVAMNNGKLKAVPQDRLLFTEASFTDGGEIPEGGIKRQTTIWTAEN